MSKQRRKRLNRTKHIRSHRSSIRNGVEQLESRVLPGGFLDLLAGAAFVSNLDLLPAEQFVPEEIDAESDAVTHRSRPTNRLQQTGLSLPEIDHEANKGSAKPTQSDEDLDVVRASRATTNSLVAASFVDSFFTSNQFIDTSSRLLDSPSPPLASPSRSFSSPISQLGAGIGSGSGQGYNVTGAELPQSSIASTPIAASSIPAWMMGEGEGASTASGTASASGSGSGAGTATGTASASGTSSGSGGTHTVSSCEGPPSTARGLYFRRATDSLTEEAEGWLPDWDYKDDAANEGLVVGNPSLDEDLTFGTPLDIPVVDQSFLAWLEVTRSRSYDEFVHGISKGNTDLVDPRVIEFKWTSTAGNTQVNTSSQEITAAITGQFGTIGTEVSASIEATESTSQTFETTENWSVAPCSVRSGYDYYRVTDVTLKYVYYHDYAISWVRDSGTTTILSRQYLGDVPLDAPGVIRTHTVPN